MEFIKFVVATILIYTTESAGGLSANGNMFGNFARWNEPSREGSLSKKVDYKVVNASPVESPSSSSHHTRPPPLPLVEMFPSGPPMSPVPLLKGNKLHIQVYRALMDAVVLDWTISLADKDRMKTCVVTYLAQEAKESTTIDPFMPKTRTFLLENLRPNHSYKFNMSCEDDSGHFLHSDSLEFSTRHISSLRNRDSTHSGDNKSDYLTEMNLKLLPAISNSIQQETALARASAAAAAADNTIIGDDPIKVSTSSLSRSYYTKKTSPHAVLGVSCAIFGAILVGITVALALRRYSQYKRSQTRLWELQTVQELERPVMPTFINLPPPYSEQPSPLYNLCASSISSGSNFCEQHMRNAIPNPLANQPCCHHHHFCENSGSSITSSQSSQYETLPSSRTGNGCEQGSKQEVASDFSAPASILESSECKSSDQNTEENTTDTESTSAF